MEPNPKPNVLQQTFFISVGINSLAVTKTARGITGKQILGIEFILCNASAAIETDQILAINRQFLDPKRPPKGSVQNLEQLREEGIIPYDPVIPISHKFIINYYRRLYKLRGIETDAAYLESTSLVAAFGLDVFFTRVAPSGTYDILNADFNYPALILTSVTLLVATFVSKSASKRADLTRLWR